MRRILSHEKVCVQAIAHAPLVAGAIVSLRDRFRSIWVDAVWSKVIAAGIVEGLTLLPALLRRLLPSVTAPSGLAASAPDLPDHRGRSPSGLQAFQLDTHHRSSRPNSQGSSSVPVAHRSTHAHRR